MPIANCIITPQSQAQTRDNHNLIDLWADITAVSGENMTINIITSSAQFGNKYAIMANLLLPSMWSKLQVSNLQLGLATALAKYYRLPIEDIFISTQIIQSGLVVEAGKEVTWPPGGGR